MAKKGRIRAKITESKDSTNTAKRIIGKLRSKPFVVSTGENLQIKVDSLEKEIDSLKLELKMKETK